MERIWNGCYVRGIYGTSLYKISILFKVKELIIISFSGGRTSAMMTKWLLDYKQDEYDFIVVFSNTGHERKATLEFVKQCDDNFGFNTVWIESITNKEFGIGVKAKVVTFDSAYRNILKSSIDGSNNIDPFESMIAKIGIPNIANPQCSRELKGATVRAYIRSLGIKKYKTALGIRYDEPSRLNWTKAYKEKLIYPFAGMVKVQKSDVNAFWGRQKFDLQLKSYEGNCILCYKKAFRKLQTIIYEEHEETLAEIEWIKHIEKTYGYYIPETRLDSFSALPPFVMFRDNKGIEDLIADSKLPFDLSQDESHIIDTYKQASLWDNELDSNFGCVESCEAF